MPKIQIKEHDLTSNPFSFASDNVIYIPGPSGSTQPNKSKKEITEDSTAEINESTEYYTSTIQLCKTENELTTFVSEAKDQLNLSFRLAKYLIKNYGFYVLYEKLDATETAFDITKINWKNLQDKGLYDIRFLTTGQFGGLCSGMIECAATRGDCIALCDHDKTLTDSTDKSSVVANIRNTFETLFTQITKGHEFAAAFTPWFQTKNIYLTGDKTGETSSDIPASFGYLFAYGKMLRNDPEWYATAGSQRGVIPELYKVNYKFSEEDCEILQARSSSANVELDSKDDNNSFAINPIVNVRPFGEIIWGNRTLLKNDSSKGLKATSFLNVRNLVTTIKKTMYNAARRYTFDQNNTTLWINFSNAIIPVLEQMKAGNGILGYKLVQVQTDKKARLKASLTIVPVEAVEDFEIDIYMDDTLEVSE